MALSQCGERVTTDSGGRYFTSVCTSLERACIRKTDRTLAIMNSSATFVIPSVDSVYRECFAQFI